MKVSFFPNLRFNSFYLSILSNRNDFSSDVHFRSKSNQWEFPTC